MNFTGKVFVFAEKKSEEKTNMVGKLINKYGMSMNLIRIDSKSYLRDKMKKLTGETTAPRVFLNSTYIGGLDELQRLEASRKLKGLVIQCKLSQPGKLDKIWSTQWEVFKIQPPMLFFPDPSHQNIHTEMTLYNRLDRFILFKVQTTSPGKFCVRPVFGMVCPRGSQVIRFEMFLTTEYGSRDKFRVDSITMGPEFEKESFSKLNIREFFKNVPSMKQKIPCRFDNRIPEDFQIHSIDKKTVRVTLKSHSSRSRSSSKKTKKRANSHSSPTTLKPSKNPKARSPPSLGESGGVEPSRKRRVSSSAVVSSPTSPGFSKIPKVRSSPSVVDKSSGVQERSSMTGSSLNVNINTNSSSKKTSHNVYMTPVVKNRLGGGVFRSGVEKSFEYLEKSMIQHMTKFETLIDREIHAILTDGELTWESNRVREEIGKIDLRVFNLEKWKQIGETITSKLNRLKEIVSEKDEKSNDAATEENDCVVCMDKKRKVVFLPCKHMCTCEVCSEQCKECPMCRSKVESRLNVFI